MAAYKAAFFIMENETLKKCYNSALRHLARKDYSEYKLKQKLRDKGYEGALIKEVIGILLEKNYLREDLYKEARIKGLLRKGYAFNVIEYRMSQEMCPVSEEEIYAVADEVGISKASQLQELVEKKVRIDYDFVSDKLKLKDRVLRYACLRGHPIGEVARAYENIIQEFEA